MEMVLNTNQVLVVYAKRWLILWVKRAHVTDTTQKSKSQNQNLAQVSSSDFNFDFEDCSDHFSISLNFLLSIAQFVTLFYSLIVTIIRVPNEKQ